MITLPHHPAVNNLFATFRGRRIPSRRYTAWQAEAAALLAEQQPPRILGPFIATLVFTRPDRRKRDLDGLAKAPLDALVKAGVIEDDSLCQGLSLCWSAGSPDKNGGVRIVLEAA